MVFIVEISTIWLRSIVSETFVLRCFAEPMALSMLVGL